MKNYIELGPYINWRQFQHVPRHKIAYLEYGNRASPNALVCAHGLTRNSHDFDKLAARLKEDFRIIAIDYPGRGNSDYFANKKHYNYNVYLKDTFIILKELQIENPVWLGTSMGGIIGMAIAAYYPKMLKGLILNDIGPFMPFSTIVKIGKYAAQPRNFNDLKAAKQHLKMIYSQCGITCEEDWDYITRNSFILNEAGLYQMNYDPAIVKGMRVNFAKPKDVNIWNIWNKISCPLLLIHGAKSDILQASTVEEMKRTKQIDLHVVNYAGHAPALVSEDQIDPIKLWLGKLGR